ncbi:lysine transporter LysE [Bordetella genomosp. 10]|uniref:Lysine transporter LysE n=1 Tax=Bordetella genomosp. 10 TaxID=1416804 RepID=A0A261S0Y9_9BORD|nr:LysE family translocator [Bordetella genomosp. 10]OZI30835.1 lysine transporter LysE [Bordetella genomosp. 10]
MIAWKIWVLFLGYSVPMVISPGPGNTLLATAGGRHGVAGALSFWIGFEAANLLLCAVYGLGLGRILHGIPALESLLKCAGIAYLLYLAWGFFRSAATSGPAAEAVAQRLRARDGFLSVLLNPKIHSMILVMFAQFLDPGASLLGQALQLTAGFLAVCVVCHFPWIYGGQLVLRRFQSARATRIQGVLFGLCMLLVAGYVAQA